MPYLLIPLKREVILGGAESRHSHELWSVLRAACVTGHGFSQSRVAEGLEQSRSGGGTPTGFDPRYLELLTSSSVSHRPFYSPALMLPSYYTLFTLDSALRHHGRAQWLPLVMTSPVSPVQHRCPSQRNRQAHSSRLPKARDQR